MADKPINMKNLSGPQKAAIVMFALDQERSAKLFGMMDLEEIKEVSSTMSQLGAVPSEIVEGLFVEFVNEIAGTGNLTGSFDSTERLLRSTLEGGRVEEIMEELRGPAGRTMWDKLGNVNEQVLANYLKNEYPQTVAVVLSKVRPSHASRVLGLLPEDFSAEVVMRMLRMETVQREVLEDIEKLGIHFALVSPTFGFRGCDDRRLGPCRGPARAAPPAGAVGRKAGHEPANGGD